MRRKTSNVPTRIWTYGCHRPTQGADLMHEQLRLSHRYYNQLIEIERDRRQQYRAVRAKFADPEIERRHNELKLELESAVKALKAFRATQRKRVGNAELTERVRELKRQRRTAYEAVKLERAKLKDNEELKLIASAINEAAGARIRGARKTSGLYWGSYLLIEKAIEAARGAQADPRFKRFTGEGRIGVQIHGTLTTAGLFNRASNVLQIDPLPDSSWDSRSGRRHARTTVRIRAGSNEAREPIWVELPVTLHRKLPDGVIKWAWIKIRRVGTRTRLELQLTIESESFGECRRRGAGVVALDLGWRTRPSGIRVGYLVDDRGCGRELLMPARIENSLRYAEVLRGHQDRCFDEARAMLADWIDSNESAAPDWLKEERPNVQRWRSPARLNRLVERWFDELALRQGLARVWNEWKTERLGAGKDLYAPYAEVQVWVFDKQVRIDSVHVYLEWWRRKNRHLFQWQARARERALGHRRELYRWWAAELAAGYETVVLEDLNLSRLARKVEPEESGGKDYLQSIRQLTAPGELRRALVTALGKERLSAQSAVNSTRECHRCRKINEWTDQEKLMLRCQHCGAEWDQDENAARILLARYFESFGDDGSPASSREALKNLQEGDSRSDGEAGPITKKQRSSHTGPKVSDVSA